MTILTKRSSMPEGYVYPVVFVEAGRDGVEVVDLAEKTRSAFFLSKSKQEGKKQGADSFRRARE